MTEWEPIQSLIDNAAINDHNLEVAVTHVLKYWDAMNAVEKRFLAQTKPELREVIAAKTEIHEQYWMPTDDDYWKPCSHGNDEEYRVADIANISVMSDYRSSFIVRVTIRSDCSRWDKRDTVYLLQTEDGGEAGPLRIVNQFS